MSAQAQSSADAPARDTEPAIVVEFRERLLNRYPECDDVDSALARAEQEPSTTDRTDMGRCPACGSVKLQQKPGTVEVEQQKDGQYRCSHCRHHFETPITQTTWEVWL